MKKNKILLIVVCMLAMLCFVSCVGDMEVRKKQSQTTRDVGEAYMMQGNYTPALREFLKAKELYPDDHILQNDLGFTYMAKKELDLAIVHFKKAVALKPDFAPAKNNLGSAYLAKKDWDTAIECFKEITKDLLYATPHYPLSNLGWAYYNKKDYNYCNGKGISIQVLKLMAS